MFFFFLRILLELEFCKIEVKNVIVKNEMRNKKEREKWNGEEL